MRKLAAVIILLLATLSLRPIAVHACGGTLTRFGSGPRFLRYEAKKNPASVALYAPGDGPFATFAPELQSYLAGEGHKVRTITTEAALNDALKLGQLDAIITDFPAAIGIHPSASSHASVVPIAYKLSKADKAKAKAYKYRIENPNDGYGYMDALYKIMMGKGSKLS